MLEPTWLQKAIKETCKLVLVYFSYIVLLAIVRSLRSFFAFLVVAAAGPLRALAERNGAVREGPPFQPLQETLLVPPVQLPSVSLPVAQSHWTAAFETSETSEINC